MLETLKDVKKVGDFNIVVMDRLRESNPEMFRPDGSMHYHLFEEKIRPFNFIYLREDVNSITFNLKKEGQEGCHISTILETVMYMLENLDTSEYKNGGQKALKHLREAVEALYCVKQIEKI